MGRPQPANQVSLQALTDQSPMLVAYANDVSFDAVLVEQLKIS